MRACSSCRWRLDLAADDDEGPAPAAALGCACLEEHAEWILLHRERPLEGPAVRLMRQRRSVGDCRRFPGAAGPQGMRCTIAPSSATAMPTRAGPRGCTGGWSRTASPRACGAAVLRPPARAHGPGVPRPRRPPSAGHLGPADRVRSPTPKRLVVLCSPDAARSPYVVPRFKWLGRGDRIYAFIVGQTECRRCAQVLPHALRRPRPATGTLDLVANPIAADARGGTAVPLALKLLAGLFGLPLDTSATRGATPPPAHGPRSPDWCWSCSSPRCSGGAGGIDRAQRRRNASAEASGSAGRLHAGDLNDKWGVRAWAASTSCPSTANGWILPRC